MAKFNPVKNPVIETENKEGGYAIERSPKDELVMMTVCNLIGEPSYYNDGNSSIKEYEHALDAVLSYDPEFVLRLAVYARNVLHLRSAPMFIINRYTMQSNRIIGAHKYISMAIKRVDDMTELVALQLAYCGAITNPVKRAISKSFLKFDEYQYSKYKGTKHNVALRDVMFLTHPKPQSQEQERIFSRIANNTLTPADTWEVAISTKGNIKENWIDILPKMGIMATVRNLRNLEEAGVPVCEYEYKFAPSIIKQSKMFPYRFYSAYKSVSSRDNGMLLLKAIDTATENIPEYYGKTAVIIDISGSMWQHISKKSTIKMYEIGSFMGACLANEQENVQVIVFGTKAEEISIKAHDNIMSIHDKVENVVKANRLGHGTNVYKAFELLDWDVERIIIMSDMQFGCYENDIRDYKGKKPIYAFNLSSYPKCSFNRGQTVVEIGGFSDKVFELIGIIENKKMSSVVDDYFL